jgi:hypothetical protein
MSSGPPSSHHRFSAMVESSTIGERSVCTSLLNLSLNLSTSRLSGLRRRRQDGQPTLQLVAAVHSTRHCVEMSLCSLFSHAFLLSYRDASLCNNLHPINQTQPHACTFAVVASCTCRIRTLTSDETPFRAKDAEGVGQGCGIDRRSLEASIYLWHKVTCSRQVAMG